MSCFQVIWISMQMNRADQCTCKARCFPRRGRGGKRRFPSEDSSIAECNRPTDGRPSDTDISWKCGKSTQQRSAKVSCNPGPRCAKLQESPSVGIYAPSCWQSIAMGKITTQRVSRRTLADLAPMLRLKDYHLLRDVNLLSH